MSQTETQLSVNGLLLLNKPQGLTSNAALQQVKRLFKAKKAGHTGSLDPLATGMLPICFGEATKFCQYLLADDKTYIATGLLGVKTNTGDSFGEVVAKVDHINITEEALQAAINQFVGPILQIPSMFSALKFKGQPLYKLARQGVTIERQARQIVIHVIKLLSFDGYQFKIKIFCSKGTYIRNLIEDIGECLGVHAHMTQLHRLSINHFQDERMYDLATLNTMDFTMLQSCLLPPVYAVNYLPMMILDEQEEGKLRQGKVIEKKINDDQDLKTGYIRLHTLEKHFIGLGELDITNKLKVKRLLTKKASC